MIPFSLAVPVGLELTLLTVFVMIGGFGVSLALSARDLGLAGATALHSLAGVLSLLARDLIILLISWELLAFSAFWLIRRVSVPRRLLVSDALPDTGGQAGGSRDAAARASFWYIGGQICAAALFFVAITVHVGTGGSLEVAPLASAAQPAMALGVFIKTAMMPLHGWLVGSYARAGALAGFVLSAFATKVGVYTAARTLAVSLFSLPIVSVVGALVAVVAVIFALSQHSARRLLSFHIISQVAYMLVGVGLAGSATSATSAVGIDAGIFHAINHIIYKALLFLVAAVAIDYFGHDDLDRMGGLARHMPLVFVCGVVGALAITGVPGFSGYASKELLKKASGGLLSTLLTVASVGTALSFSKFIYLIFLRPRPRVDGNRPSVGRVPAFVLVVLAGLSVAIGLSPHRVPGAPMHDYYAVSSVLAGVWPAMLGIGLWVVSGRWLMRIRGAVDPQPMLRRMLAGFAKAALPPLRRAHATDAQLALGITITAAIAITSVLVFL